MLRNDDHLQQLLQKKIILETNRSVITEDDESWIAWNMAESDGTVNHQHRVSTAQNSAALLINYYL